MLAVFISGCASSTKQADSLLSVKTSLPDKIEISNVPFIKQEAGHCGPATLTMAMKAVGKEVELATITSQVYSPNMKGTFQTDMMSATRRQGMLAIPIENLDGLLTEVAAGNPVIIFENLAFEWFPQWHYALVYGYDLKNEIIIMHSGSEQAMHWDLRKFERSWKLGDYWGMVVLPPGQLSATGSELAHVTAAAALEKLQLSEEALIAYNKILTRWPESLGALIGTGNCHFAKSNYAESAIMLSLAVRHHPSSAIAWHNLAIAQKLLKQSPLAKASALKAIALATETQKIQYEKTLKELL
jgi:tetratricopeptide (TPR) repeat protein